MAPMIYKMSWDDLKRNLAIGTIVTGKVISHEVYGIYLDVKYGYDAVIPRTEFKDEGKMTEEEYPKIGSDIKAKVIGFRDHGQQIWMTIKPSQFRE